VNPDSHEIVVTGDETHTVPDKEVPAGQWRCTVIKSWIWTVGACSHLPVIGLKVVPDGHEVVDVVVPRHKPESGSKVDPVGHTSVGATTHWTPSKVYPVGHTVSAVAG